MTTAAHALSAGSENNKYPGVALVATKARLIGADVVFCTPAMSAAFRALHPGAADRENTGPGVFADNTDSLAGKVGLIRPNVYDFSHVLYKNTKAASREGSSCAE